MTVNIDGKIDGAMPAEKAVEAVQNKLSEFGLDLEKHVVACVTDGASVMVKFGSWHHQLCYAHGIHLAVCDILYRKTDTVVEAPSEVVKMQMKMKFAMNLETKVI